MGDAGPFLRAARQRHGLDQRTFARLAGTSQTQISRIERGQTSPTVASLARLLTALGERLELVAAAPPQHGTPEFVPDHAAERRLEHAATTPAERVVAAIRLSRTATAIAAAEDRTDLARLRDVRRA